MNKRQDLLSKGNSTLLILSVIAESDLYGYQIAREIENLSDNVFSMKEGTLYPVLHAMEKEGNVESYWLVGENERKRKYYRITNKGIKQLNESKKEWEAYSDAVNKIVSGRKINATT